MHNETMPIADLIVECDKYLRSLGYGKDRMKMYNQIWQRFSRYADAKGQNTYTNVN
jgi:hypothetical protein